MMRHERVEKLLERIEQLEEEIRNFEVEVTDEEYDAVLDDIFGDVKIAGIPYSTSEAFKLVDETAYRVGKNDFEASLDLEEDPRYEELLLELEEAQEEFEELTSEEYDD